MVVCDAYVFPGFLTPVLTQLFFPKPLTTFLTCFCKNTPERKVASTEDQTHNHQVMSLICSPLSFIFKNCYTPVVDFVYTLSSANIEQSAPNLGKNIYVQLEFEWVWSWVQLDRNKLELFALELGKIAAFDFVYSLTSTNINQSAPNLVTMYMRIRPQMSLIMGQVIPDQCYLPLNRKIELQ